MLTRTDFFSCALDNFSLEFGVLTCPSPVGKCHLLACISSQCPDLSIPLDSQGRECPALARILAFYPCPDLPPPLPLQLVSTHAGSHPFRVLTCTSVWAHQDVNSPP